jgi:hypothetical protein
MPVNEITASKAEYALALTALGLKVSSYIPERVVPPVVIISPGSPYLTPTLLDRGEWVMNLELMVVGPVAVNVKATESLDKAIETILNGNPGYSQIVNVGQPYGLQTNNAEYLAANISVNVRITL